MTLSLAAIAGTNADTFYNERKKRTMDTKRAVDLKTEKEMKLFAEHRAETIEKSDYRRCTWEEATHIIDNTLHIQSFDSQDEHAIHWKEGGSYPKNGIACEPLRKKRTVGTAICDLEDELGSEGIDQLERNIEAGKYKA